MFNPLDWYWVDASGRVFGSARGGIVAAPQTDATLMAWQAQDVSPTAWPKDEAGLQTDKALQSVLAEYGLHVSRKDALSATVNAKRDEIIAAGYRHNFGSTAGIRTLDQRNVTDAMNWLGLNAIANAMIAGGQGAGMLSIRDAQDETFEASANVVAGAMVSMGQWRGQVMGYAWALKDAVAAADSQAELDAIDIDAGWPDA